jgi:hypothetical protein
VLPLLQAFPTFLCLFVLVGLGHEQDCFSSEGLAGASAAVDFGCPTDPGSVLRMSAWPAKYLSVESVRGWVFSWPVQCQPP